MADAQADIIINVDTSIGIAEIKNLQRQIASLNTQLLKSGAQQIRAADNIQRNLINNINATGKFAASVKNISTTAESFTSALEKNKLSMGEYFRYAGASTKTFGRLFANEFNTIEKVARERVKTLQTQYIKLGRDANGAMKAIAVRPLALDMENLATKTAIAAQKQQLFNQLVKQGSTNLLNFGKNTQWAGRQLMVGFTIPLSYMGTAAAKTFMEMEKQAIRFRRVYGDTFTATAETDAMLGQIKSLASEFTKYGVSVEKTMGMAADAAAMGKVGADLLAQVQQATTLAVLGGVEQEQALETTISLTNAFGIAADELSKKINFLNAVENQTVTSIEDLTIAIPKAGPVIQQLGGDVEDLAFFLTAMKEGGINASEGANALKSGLASLINPTEKAAKFLEGFGINLRGIVEANKGNVKGIVLDFAQSLDQLDPLSRARAIEQLFGKFQFARLSTLFQNVIAEGTQAERVLRLSATTSEELAILSERELKRIEESPMYKFQKAVEDLKVSLVPLGEAFLKAVTPLVEFAKGFLDGFNNMSESAKQFAVVATTAVAGIGPILLMTFGLVANGVANLIKMFAFIGKVFRGTGASSTELASQTEYMTQQQLEAAAVAASLEQTHSKLIQTFTSETAAVNQLATAYGRAVVSQAGLLGIDPTTGMPVKTAGKATGGRRGGKKPTGFSQGTPSVPGPLGAGDIVPALLSPGEAVIPADQAQKYSGIIEEILADKPTSLSHSQASVTGIIASHGNKYRTLNDIDAAEFARQNLDPKSRGYKNFMNPTGRGRNIYSNLVFGMPAKFNLEEMSGLDAARWIRNNPEGFFSYLSAMYGLDSGSNAARTFANNLSTNLGRFGTSLITDDMFYSAVEESQKNISDKTFKAIFNQAASDFKTGEVFSSKGKSRREALISNVSGARSYTRFRKPIRERFNVTAINFEKDLGMAPAAQKAVAPKSIKPSRGTTRQGGINPRTYSLRAIMAAGAQYNDGVVSVPGPKGAGDVVPAMLSPGEAVIPAGMAKRYAPLISSMISGSIPGYAKGRTGGWKNPNPQTQKGNRGVVTRQEAALFEASLAKAAGGGQVKRAFSSLAGAFTGVIVQGLVDFRTSTMMFQERFREEKAITDKQMLARQQKNAERAALRSERKRAAQTRRMSGPMLGPTLPMGGFTRQQESRKALVAQGKQKFMGRAGAIGGAAGMAAMMYGMSGGPGAEIAGMASLPLMMLPQILPMIMNPVGAAIAGLVAVGAGLVIFNNHLNEVRKTTAQAAEGLVASRDKLMSIAEFAGTVTPGEYLAKRRQSQFGQINPNQVTFGQSFMASDAGKALLDSFNLAVSQFGRSKAISGLQKQISLSVATGILSTEQAQSIAMNLGQELNDYGITASINASIAEIVGPDGKPLDGNTITIYTKFIEESAGGLTGPGGLLSSDLLKNQNIFMPGETAKLEGAAATGIKGFFAESQQAIEAFDAQNLKAIDALRAEGKFEEALQKEKTYYANREALLKNYNTKVTEITNDFNYMSKASQEATIRNLKDQANAAIPEVTASMSKFADAWGRGTAEEANVFRQTQMIITAQVAAGNIAPEAFNSLISMFDPNTKSGQGTLNIIANMSTRISPEATGQFATIAQILNNPGKTEKLAVEINAKTAGDAQNTLNTLTEIANIGESEGLKASVILEDITGDTNKLDEITSKFTKLNELKAKGGLSIKMLVESEILTSGDAEILKSQAKALGIDLEKATPGQVETFTKVFLAKYEAVAQDEIQVWRDANPNIEKLLTNDEIAKRLAAESAAKYVKANPEVDLSNIDKGKGPGTTEGTKKDPFEDVLNRLKRFRNASIDASKGLNELKRLFRDGGKEISKFAGTEQQLLSKGFGRDFIDAVLAMDKSTQQSFIKIKNGIVSVTNAGKNLNAAMGRAVIGEFVTSTSSQITSISNQMSAMRKLISSGLSVADAYEIIQDETLAYSIATNKNKKDVEKLISVYQRLKQAQLELANANVESRSSLVDETLSKIDDYYNARESQVERDFERGTNESGRNAAKTSIKAISDTISTAQKEIADYQFTIDDLQYQLDGIAEQESEINKKYDERGKALDKIFSANESIAEQQRSQLAIADAITQGDIAAAARAIQEAEQQRIAKAKEDQQALLDTARAAEIDAIRSANGKSRAQLEKEILDIQKNIAQIEEARLEPAEKALRYAEDARNVALDAVSGENYLGKNKDAWDNIALATKLATTASDEYRQSIIDTLKAISGFKSLFDQFGNLIGFDFNASDFVSGKKTIGGMSKETYASFTALASAAQAEQISSGLGQAGIAGPTLRRALRMSSGGMVKGYYSGGMVKRFANGGFAMGSDTVPAMLTPGEFVMSRYAVQSYGVDNMKAINSGTYNGDSVYNYDISINVQSNSDANQIANVVMAKIRQIDAQKIKGSRF